MIPLLTSFCFAGDVLDDGHAVRGVLFAQTVTLDQPMRYDWTAERPLVTTGTFLVLDVDPAWLVPSDTQQAVLYVGDVPAARLNTGWPGGTLAVFVPGTVDVTTAPIYFGGYELAETVDAKAGAATLAAARKKGFGPRALPMQLTAVHYADERALVALAAAFGR